MGIFNNNNIDQSRGQESQVLFRNPANPQNMLELSDTKEQIEDFVLDLCGLKKTKEGEKIIIKRFTKPIYAYEFTQKIKGDLYISINRISGRTTFDKEEIVRYLNVLMGGFILLFATVGMKNLISDKAWELILAKYYKKEWDSKHNIKWSYDENVNMDMLNIIKEENPELKTESFHQQTISGITLESMMVLIHSGLNKSRDALTINFEGQVYKEVNTTEYNQNRKSNENALDGLRRTIGNNVP